MNEPPVLLPADLAATVRADLRPVRPLPSPMRRLAYVLPLAALAIGLPFTYFRLRDLEAFGVMLGWVPVALQLLVAIGLLGVALREAVPGFRVSALGAMALCLAAYALQILVNLGIYLSLPLAGGTRTTLDMWFACFRLESLIGLPILLAVGWMVARALPQRPMLAGFLAGTGAGLAAEASWRLICYDSTPFHVLAGHTGGVVLLGLTGVGIGLVWQEFGKARAAAR